MCRMTPLRAVMGVCLGTVAATTLVAQTPSQPQDLPTFRGGVQLIDVDVVVTGRDGKPVRGLTQDDFEIVEANRPQQIRTFSVVDLPFAPPQMLAERRAREVEPDVVTNTAEEGRTYVLLIDKDGRADLALRRRHVAERWLSEVVQPNDRVAVLHTEGGFIHSQGLTTSTRLILEAINHTPYIAGGISDGPDPMIYKWRLLKEIADRLGTIPGRRKAIVWFAVDIDLHPQARLRPGEGAAQRGLEDPAAASMSHILAAWREAAEAAVNNNVAIYPVDSDGLTTTPGLGNLIKQ